MRLMLFIIKNPGRPFRIWQEECVRHTDNALNRAISNAAVDSISFRCFHRAGNDRSVGKKIFPFFRMRQRRHKNNERCRFVYGVM
jgi:hypothetical protein